MSLQFFRLSWRLLRPSPVCVRCQSSSAAPSNPLLTNIRNDMKLAMRAKDTPRLSVLKNLLAEITNASHTSSPISTSPQLLSLIRKRITSTQGAMDEFAAANRADLVEKEGAQMKILEEYAEKLGSGMVGEAEIKAIVQRIVEDLKSHDARIALGDVLKKAMSEFEGQDIEKKEVVRIVKETIG